MKRYAIYQYFNPYGRLEDVYKESILALKDLSQQLLVVVNGSLDTEGKQFLASIGVDLLIRENKGYDFHGYKAGIFYFGEKLKEVDELILMNCSVYGPFVPMEPIFLKMQRDKKIDFWGLTRNKGIYAEHIQSYFMVFRNSVIKHNAFWSFWENLADIRDRRQAILIGELQLTEFLLKKNFKYSTYLSNNYEDFSNPLFDGALVSLKNGIPFVKRELYTRKKAYEELLQYTGGYLQRQIWQQLTVKWQNLILGDLIANFPQSVWSASLGLNYFLSSDGENEVIEQDAPLALIFYVWYEDNVNLILRHLRAMPVGSYIYLVSGKKSILDVYQSKVLKTSEYSHLNFDFRTQPNRGRNEAAFFVRCKDVFERHDFICLFHDKKVLHEKPSGLGITFFEYQLRCLLNSRHQINLIHKKFKENHRVGIIQPLLPLIGRWMGVNTLAPKLDKNNSGNTEWLRQKLALRLPLDPEMNFPVGGSFWVRSSAMKILLDKGLTYDFFPEEPLPTDLTPNHALERLYPLIAQEAGFYTANTINIEELPSYLSTLQYYLKTYYVSSIKRAPLSLMLKVRTKNVLTKLRLWSLARRIFHVIIAGK